MEKSLIALIIIAVITVIALIGSIYKMKDGFGPFNLKVYGLILVLGFSAIIVMSDISTEKMTACFGIIGAVAGYLFGL